MSAIISDVTPRIYIAIPYFGKLPAYFQLYLNSLAANQDILTVLLMTDVGLSEFTLPPNLIHIHMRLSDLRSILAELLQKDHGLTVSPAQLVKTPYKLVDFKILYPKLFKPLFTEHGARPDIDYVGFGDCDLIYGRLSHFIDFRNNYDIIGGYHGHLIAFRNTIPFHNLYKSVPDILKIWQDDRVHIADEIAFRQPLLNYLAEGHLKMFYTNAHFCDIVPPCFFGRFRPDHAARTKNFFDVYNPTKDITHVTCEIPSHKLTVHYDDNSSREALYVHLQKRPHPAFVPPPGTTAYRIADTGFTTV
jgi:hypothetical protein